MSKYRIAETSTRFSVEVKLHWWSKWKQATPEGGVYFPPSIMPSPEQAVGTIASYHDLEDAEDAVARMTEINSKEGKEEAKPIYHYPNRTTRISRSPLVDD